MHIARLLAGFISLATTQPLTKHRRDWRLGKRLYIIVGIIVAIATIVLALFLTRSLPVINVNPPFGWNHTDYGDGGKVLQTAAGVFVIGGLNYSPTSVGSLQVIHSTITLQLHKFPQKLTLCRHIQRW